MYLISFMHFKQCCRHFEMDYDFDKHVCLHSAHGVDEHYATVPDGPDKGKRYTYHRCCAKHCPELAGRRMSNENGDSCGN